MRRTSSFAGGLLQALVLVSNLSAEAVETKEQAPSTIAPKGRRPSAIVKELAERPPPELVGEGDVAYKNALAYIDWAAASTKAHEEVVRKALANARGNQDIVRAFCNEAFAKQDSDHSRTLVTLALLGEVRSPHGEECLTKFVSQPLPDKGTIVEGEILEQTALATLQAKAIDGLAYLRSESADRVVLEAVAKHPSRIVRAEAIAAYLWNHKYSADARKILESYVRNDERIFLDRPVREAREPRESFNRKLDAYMKAHPEVRPPRPRKVEVEAKPVVGKPPQF